MDRRSEDVLPHLARTPRTQKTPRNLKTLKTLTAAVVACAATASLATASAASAEPGRDPASADGPAAPAPGRSALPTVSPTPQSLVRTGADIPVPDRVDVVVGEGTDEAARELLVRVLREHGVSDVRVRRTAEAGEPAFLLGPATRPDIAEALDGTEVPEQAEGYALRVGEGERGSGVVALGGTDAAGQFYAVQTLRQLFVSASASAAASSTGRAQSVRLAGVAVSDHPSMPLRGSIEGFYGPPWTEAERLDQMEFLGDVRANTYVYAPKDDPYHREKWREPYPAEKLAELTRLVDRARAHHVRFTFALSPGASICYSDPADTTALVAKLQAMYDAGVRAFSVPLDDISYTKWNCAADEKEFGAPGRGPAAAAQVSLLNTVQREFVATHEGARPLQTVPTEYGDLTDTDYKSGLRSGLDPAVEVMWTGTDVVPPEITNDQAAKASELFGRKVFVWDNYPVNDFDRTRGRLLLAPYDKRERGLSQHITGLVSNPMNQESASKLAMFTMADFSWNDRAYDRTVSGRQAALYLAGGNAGVADAVERFVDLNHLAPTFGDQPWQPQSPRLTAELDAFWKQYAQDPAAALRALRGGAVRDIARVPATLRESLPDKLFLSDAARWLDATALWGRAMRHGVDALAALESGDTEQAETERTAMRARAAEASKITVDPQEHHQVGSVRVGDPLIENFLGEVEKRLDGTG
ncbi:beta-N-acetylglucosaminidase domain-containing protein [Streptomyces sp. NA04227]|uniref:beta-N-acetylhexosaminidase family protein n=1 Tax=Streptomyces sp. NA04227 TaxID=2742136 RepID=UPI001590F480|nr:beta-N-acetylglucosaminidase domain-containing protein [Streptomyces sp. NA04227]QKW05749.1 beta-N-acetylglucosaminidase domain-containing protein [Streptomyces sp. NA04227]